MARVKVQRVTPTSEGVSKRELYATICFYFPAYKLSDVQALPARDVKLLLDTVKKLEASRQYNLTQIVAAPHSKKGANVKKLLEYFEGLVGKK